MNNEAKVRQSINLIVLGKAKIISYKNIEKTRTKRATKKITKGKEKRDRKRKDVALKKDKLKPKSKLEVTRIIEASKP